MDVRQDIRLALSKIKPRIWTLAGEYSQDQ